MKPRWFMVIHEGVKVVAIVAGFVVTVVGLMSLIGLLTPNGWVRSIVAVVVALALPALIEDRMRTRTSFDQLRGLASDVFALVWAVLATLFLVIPQMRTLMLREGDRETTGGAASVAKVTYFLAGVAPNASPATPTVPVASSGAGAGSSAPSAPSTASPPADAGAKPRPDAGHTSSAEHTPAELFRDLAPDVVTVSVKGAGGPLGMDSEGGGTGFILDTEGTTATNHHVIEGAKEVRVKLFSGAWVENGDIELLADDRVNDLALLRIHTKETLKPVELGDSDGVAVGEHVLSIGNPLGLEHTLTDGLVSARRMYEGRAYIQMSAPVSPGNSGGPLFNMQGEVIGITTAQVAGGLFGRAQNLNLALPVNQLKTMIKSDYPQRHPFGKDATGASSW